LQILSIPNSAILGYIRQTQGETLLVLNNLTSEFQRFGLPTLGLQIGAGIELFSSTHQDLGILTSGEIELEPYGFRWYLRDQ